MENKQTGFTLIELLVVIAVIGILASTLLVGYTGVRDRAKDARAISGMSQLRVAAESFYSKGNTYVGFNGANTDGAAIIADIDAQVPSANKVVSQSSATKYCAIVILNDGDKYCVDSTAKAIRGGSGVTCSSSTYACSGS